jgi:hypothetical protein
MSFLLFMFLLFLSHFHFFYCLYKSLVLFYRENVFFYPIRDDKHHSKVTKATLRDLFTIELENYVFSFSFNCIIFSLLWLLSFFLSIHTLNNHVFLCYIFVYLSMTIFLLDLILVRLIC